MPSIPKTKKRKARPWGNKSDQKIYQSRRWRRERLDYLAENPRCSYPGCRKSAVILDHIVSIRNGGEIWDEDNWQGLCIKHHNSKTAKESNKY